MPTKTRKPKRVNQKGAGVVSDFIANMFMKMFVNPAIGKYNSTNKYGAKMGYGSGKKKK